MIDTVSHNIPSLYPEIRKKCDDIEFSMRSDMQVGALLKTLAATKPASRILELGTGIGLSLSWLLDGMDNQSTVVSVDNNPELIHIARGYFSEDSRVELICGDGSKWLQSYSGPKFDLIFADAWPGKYSDLDITLDLLKEGGIYVIDDMKQQANWPVGHDEKVESLMTQLDAMDNFTLVKLNWSTGIIIMTKTKA